MRKSRWPVVGTGAVPVPTRPVARVPIKILYTPDHAGYLANETEKRVEMFIADDETIDRIHALMDTVAFTELVHRDAKKLLATLDPALQGGVAAVMESFSLGEANALRDLVEKKLQGSKPRWGTVVAFFVFAGEGQLKGKARNLARQAWIDEGLAQCPVATEIECPGCEGPAHLAVHLSGHNIGLRSPSRWKISCPACGYNDCSLPSSPRSEVLEPASEAEIRRWVAPSPAIADQHPLMSERRERLLVALKREMPVLRNRIQAELAQFSSAVQQEVSAGRPAKSRGLSIFLMHNPILAVEINAARLGKQWPRDHSKPTAAEEVMRQAGAEKLFTLDSPQAPFDQHWGGEFQRRAAKLNAALEMGDALEAVVQAYALHEDAWRNGLLAPFTLSVQISTELAAKILVTDVASPAVPMPQFSADGMDIEDLSQFLAAGMSSTTVTVSPSGIAALLRAYLSPRRS